MNFSKILLRPVSVGELVKNVEVAEMPFQIKSAVSAVRILLEEEKSVDCLIDNFRGASPEMGYLSSVKNTYLRVVRNFRFSAKNKIQNEVEENGCLSKETMDLILKDIDLLLNDKDGDMTFVSSVDYPALFFQVLLTLNNGVSNELKEMGLL